MNFGHPHQTNTNTCFGEMQRDLGKASSHRNRQPITKADMDKVIMLHHKPATPEEITNRIDAIQRASVPAVMMPHRASLPAVAQQRASMPILHTKRSKPRRQSGVETADITEDVFRSNRSAAARPYLPRDDSISLLKQQTTNAIPMIVPLVPAGTATTTQEPPLSRIQRRRTKPRRFSGEDVDRPVLVRDDSVTLAKKKMAMVPLTLQLEGLDMSDNNTDDEDRKMPAKPTRKTPERTRSEAAPTTTASPAATKRVPRRTRSQRQMGFVRQNSLGARTA